MISRFLIIFMLLSVSVHSQNVDSHWYFGFNAALQFADGNPENIGEGPLNVDEGSGTISDQNGNLLFSTNGGVVLDSNHNMMPNGSGLKGHSSSTQNVVIIPFPGDQENRFYYIFTVAAQVNNGQPEDNGLEYVIVDMELNNGLGDVIGASTELLPFTSEKIHATFHENMRDVWVVVHEFGTDDFYAFLVTCEGIQDPVVSSTGSVHQNDQYASGAVGALKLSHDGTMIATTFNTLNEQGFPVTAHLEFGLFNNSTGEIEITEVVQKTNNNGIQGYGVEFSPDNSKLYWSLLTPGSIFQYDSQSSSFGDSEVLVVGETWGNSFAGIQLGPDERIYIAREGGANYISRIENPNEEGVNVVLTHEAVLLSNYSALGLPNNWMFPYPSGTIHSDEETDSLSMCSGSSVELSAEIENAESYLWSTGAETPIISVDEAGFYFVEVSIDCQVLIRNFVVEEIPAPEYAVIADETICPESYVEIEVQTTGDIVWDSGSSDTIITVDESGVYGFTISNGLCEIHDDIYIEHLHMPQILTDSVIEKCHISNLLLEPAIVHADSVTWDGEPISFPVVLKDPGIFLLEAWNRCGVASKFLKVNVVKCGCNYFLPNAFTPNDDGINDIFRGWFDCEPEAFEMHIYNRWGERVFTTADYNNGWNGEMMESGYFSPDGIYTYEAHWKATINGTLFVEQINGHVSLIR